jgi:hypothetical protein
LIGKVLCYIVEVIRIGSDDPSHLAWLVEFLSPAFETGSESGWDFSVELSEDSTRYEACAKRGPHASEVENDVFTLDSRAVRLPVWNGLAEGMTLFDAQFHVFYEIPDDRRSVHLLTSTGNTAARTALMRVVRERAMSEVLRSGRLMLHASSVQIDGLGLVIAGPKFAGKTTLSTALLRSKRARYVSNDRVTIAADETPIRFRGMPSVVTIRPGTLELFPDLGQRLRSSATHPRMSLCEAAESPSSGPLQWMDGRYGLSPAQWCRLLDTKPVPEAQLSALLFPRVTQEAGGVEMLRLLPEEAARRLPETLLGAGTWRKRVELFAPPGQDELPSENALTKRAKLLAGQISCFECRLGLQAYEGDLAATLVANLRSELGRS